MLNKYILLSGVTSSCLVGTGVERGKITKPFEVLDKRTSGCFTVPCAKKSAADFVEKKNR